MSRILAIDPGCTESAWCLLEDGLPALAVKNTNERVLEMLSECDPELYAPLAIEMIASYGMAVGKEVFDTCVWIGRFWETWVRHGGTVRLVYRKEVKLFHCETVRANDANVRAAIIDKFGGKEKAIGRKASKGPLYEIKGNDKWSALAVALTAGGAAVLGKAVMA